MKKSVLILMLTIIFISIQSAEEQDQSLKKRLQEIKENPSECFEPKLTTILSLPEVRRKKNEKKKEEEQDFSLKARFKCILAEKPTVREQFFAITELPEVKRKNTELYILACAYYFYTRDMESNKENTAKIVTGWYEHYFQTKNDSRLAKNTSKLQSSIEYLNSRRYDPNPHAEELQRCYEEAQHEKSHYIARKQCLDPEEIVAREKLLLATQVFAEAEIKLIPTIK